MNDFSFSEAEFAVKKVCRNSVGNNEETVYDECGGGVRLHRIWL